MLSLKDKLNYLMTFCCFMFVSIHGRSKDLRASCDVGIMIQRGKTWRTVPQQNLTVSCPVKHCGESLKITWCKILSPSTCERISEMENVEITQNHVGDELISYLSFKQVSIHDDGLYRCSVVKGHGERIISHAINISVSDLHQWAENSNNNDGKTGELLAAADNKTVVWKPYLFIGVGIPFLILTLTAMTLLSFYDWKRVPTFNYVKGEEIPTHMIPDLPKWSPPSTPVLSTHLSILNDIHSPRTTERSKSPASQPCESQPSASKPVVKTEVCAVYAVINHRQSSQPAGKQHTVTHQVKNPVYATINVS
ncbi:B- and T-lymphocyte attenuator-like [Archocentrus centrarchus]|uniref:B- and T-lymphocyte attenuator-like n=1 Tax=Archocentrus centrarchus TaxID=63155 RepID=UPI0011EA2D34|nr:B- and T-lymphocyte attenuator-like [Archocentrus centrarchus]